MTEEECKRYLEEHQHRFDVLHRYDYRYDFTEYDPPVKKRRNIFTQNMDFDGTMSLDFVEESVRKSFYYIPDELYTSERNADPCPFVPKSMQNWMLENAPYGSKAYNDAMCYRFVEICHEFVKKRWDRWEGFCRVLFCLFGLVGLGLIGTHAESLIVYIPSYVLLTIILLCIPVQRMTPFNKRKSQYVFVDNYYDAWRKRESKRRWELALRNTDRFNLPKPKTGIFVTHDYLGRLYVDKDI